MASPLHISISLTFLPYSLQAFKAGETICTICNTLSGEKAYSSVQVLPDPPLPTSFTSSSIPQTYYSQSPEPRRHIELNSDLLYVNHSCDPNVVFEVNGREAEKGENDESGEWNGRWRVRAIKDLPVGEVSRSNPVSVPVLHRSNTAISFFTDSYFRIFLD